jgi:hypothetical protein
MLTAAAKGHLHVPGARQGLTRTQRAVTGDNRVRNACFRVMFALYMATSSHMFD